MATARRLGAVVTGFDVRPVVREQIESLGANWLDLGVVGEETAGGYAAELTEEQQRQQQEELEARMPEFDVVITTALIPGRPAPKLIPASAVAAMRPGSVVVDLAAEAGGNCELTEPGEEVVREGVTIVGLTNLPSTMPFHASQLYARNVSALLHHLAPEGTLALDWDDEITAGACVTRKAEVPREPAHARSTGPCGRTCGAIGPNSAHIRHRHARRTPLASPPRAVGLSPPPWVGESGSRVNKKPAPARGERRRA